jgi:hypothetical protein
LERLNLTEFEGLKSHSTQTNGKSEEAKEIKKIQKVEAPLDSTPPLIEKDTKAVNFESKITLSDVKPAEPKPKESKVHIQLPKTNEAVAKFDKENLVHNDTPDLKSRPIMAQYGIGNTHPTIPSNHMKTFNIKAPLKEVIFS